MTMTVIIMVTMTLFVSSEQKRSLTSEIIGVAGQQREEENTEDINKRNVIKKENMMMMMMMMMMILGTVQSLAQGCLR